MNLGSIAMHFTDDVFEVFDKSANDWVGPVKGRLDATDRFLSNFNRPTRKRMFYTNYGRDMGEFDLLRHSMTGEVYLLGTPRRDTLWQEGTTQLVICHLVSADRSSGLATVVRPMVQGSGDDLGWLIPTEVATAYVDLELRTTSAEPGSKEVQIGQYYGFSEAGTHFSSGDKLILNDRPYIVDDAAFDSGFRMLRLTARDFHWVNSVFSWAGDRVYDRDIGKFVDTEVARNVSGLWVAAEGIDPGFNPRVESEADFRVEKEHIGFDPTPGMSVEIEGKVWKIDKVGQSEYRRQWILTLRA